MITRIIVATVVASFVTPMAFSQMRYSRVSPTPQPQTSPPKTTPTPIPSKQAFPQLQRSPQKTAPTATPSKQTFPQPEMQLQGPTLAPTQVRPTPTPVPPPDVKAYLDRQLGNSKDKKFHFTVKGKDLALTPFHVWTQKSTGVDSTSTCIDMRSDDGRIYDIDFVTTGAHVTGTKIHRINGEAVR